ncbi:MAG: hypothetical protein JSS27_16765 [Planctomycetes bacterium]|nr:hypothetical protein [Planctomycetota bacterium]
MARRSLLWGLIVAGFIGTGCSMCRHPYDYCGAVIDEDGHGYGWNERRGSILGSDPRAAQNVTDEEVEPRQEPTPAAEPLPNDEAPRPPARLSRRAMRS